MNWGHGITIAIALFMGFILYLVYGTTKANIDLVSDTYYEDESHFDARRASIERGIPYSNQVSLVMENEYLVVTLPERLKGFTEGTLTLQHPVEAKADVIEKVTGLVTLVEKEKLKSDHVYNVVLSIHKDGEEIRFERSLVIP